MAKIAIRLGPHWTRFGRPRDGLMFLGTIEQGPGIGALARAADGTYLQVNGDHERKLNTSSVKAALRAVGYPPKLATRSAVVPARTMPMVVVKRRRILVKPHP